ncbi:peptidase [Pedobacter sp. KBW01]|uniref:peptidase n=1 Tax=Pedobacter sp. KBW01 TaxID=2153364 RepID=UPI000F5966AA|nr:peptidase [Pedobacter sp. KBW01]RQO78106.1 peptidase [Pedobacter sp. KBW01]
MRKPITFVLSDESIKNSYGFFVRHKGIKMARFNSNSVMLEDHNNSTKAVLGRWANTRFESAQMKAETDFDYDDKTKEVTIGKVERGFIKGASIGLIFNPAYLAYDDEGNLWLEESEMMEASICPVPSNGNSISLYSQEGELLTESDVKQLCLSVEKNKPAEIKIKDKNVKKMEKLNLSATTLVALGMQSADDVVAVSAAIERLALNYSNEKTAHDNTKVALKNMTDIQAKKLVEEAVLTGKITADLKDTYIELASSNFDLASKTLGAMPAKTTLSGEIKKPEGAAGDDPKNIDEFQALPLAKQLAFKAEKPTAYAALFV